jgi:hypothetical protein
VPLILLSVGWPRPAVWITLPDRSARPRTACWLSFPADLCPGRRRNIELHLQGPSWPCCWLVPACPSDRQTGRGFRLPALRVYCANASAILANDRPTHQGLANHHRTRFRGCAGWRAVIFQRWPAPPARFCSAVRQARSIDIPRCADAAHRPRHGPRHPAKPPLSEIMCQICHQNHRWASSKDY